ncbi:hypothetical protein AAG906_010491 [Vitis piasezkii]
MASSRKTGLEILIFLQLPVALREEKNEPARRGESRDVYEALQELYGQLLDELRVHISTKPTPEAGEKFSYSSFKEHSGSKVLESSQENISALLLGLEYLIGILYMDDTQVFKVCLDYWNSLVLELFEAHHNLDNLAMAANTTGLQIPLIPGTVDGLGSRLLQQRRLYSGPMSKLRLLMICCMAKPEVLIVENKNGNIVRETMKDNDVLVQYKIMRQILIYLSHLDHEDTEKTDAEEIKQAAER